MEVTRRQAAGAISGQVATSESAAAGETRVAGIHIYCLLKGVRPAPFTGFPYSVMVTVWGTDNALIGIGWGATIEGGDPAQSYLGAGINPTIFAVHGSVEGDVVNLTATQIFTGIRIDQGLPWLIEANLTTGFVCGVEVNAEMGTEIVLEGSGVVSRI